MDLSRREFLKVGATGALGLLTSLGLPDEVLAASKTQENGYGLLLDASRCIGCRRCMLACRAAHPLHQGEDAGDQDSLSNVTKLSAENLTFVRNIPTPEDKAKPKHFAKIQCMHCLKPGCASACPVAALVRTPEGAVTYDAGKCIGCRYCMMACPFQIPTYEWDSPVPRVRKCTLCYERVKEGQVTACAQACPAAAITFGRRNDLIEEARRRIAGSPRKYVNYIYGLTEAGGTGNLYVTDVSIETLGLTTKVPKDPLPDYPWKALSKTPHVAIGVSLLLAGLNVYTRQRDELEGRADDPASSGLREFHEGEKPEEENPR